MYFDANILTWQVVWSAVVVWLMKKMKASSWPGLIWINEHSAVVNRVVAVVASGMVALGLHWTYSYEPSHDGTLTLVLTGASWSGLLEHARDWVFSYVVQQSGYRLTPEGRQ